MDTEFARWLLQNMRKQSGLVLKPFQKQTGEKRDSDIQERSENEKKYIIYCFYNIKPDYGYFLWKEDGSGYGEG